MRPVDSWAAPAGSFVSSRSPDWLNVSQCADAIRRARCPRFLAEDAGCCDAGMRARRASPIGSPQWCALRVGIGGTSRILVLLSPITSLHSLPGAGSAPARGVTLFSGLAAGCHTPPSCMDGRPRGVRINATRIVVENVRLELTEGCLQSIPAPLRIPRVHPAELIQRRPAPVLIGSRSIARATPPIPGGRDADIPSCAHSCGFLAWNRQFA